MNNLTRYNLFDPFDELMPVRNRIDRLFRMIQHPADFIGLENSPIRGFVPLARAGRDPIQEAFRDGKLECEIRIARQLRMSGESIFYMQKMRLLARQRLDDRFAGGSVLDWAGGCRELRACD